VERAFCIGAEAQRLRSNSSGRGADSDEKENCEGIDGEEEEEENPLPATQASRTGWVMARRECTTFCKHKVVENNYGCLQNVVRTAERQNVRTSSDNVVRTSERQNIKTSSESNSSGRGADSDD
jgi:hypothetical protein